LVFALNLFDRDLPGSVAFTGARAGSPFVTGCVALASVTSAQSPPKRVLPNALYSVSLLKTHLTSLGSAERLP
jgi:hypothetical protein